MSGQQDYIRTMERAALRRALLEARDFVTMLLESRPKQVMSLLKHSGEELETRLNAALEEVR